MTTVRWSSLFASLSDFVSAVEVARTVDNLVRIPFVVEWLERVSLVGLQMGWEMMEVEDLLGISVGVVVAFRLVLADEEELELEKWSIW